MTGFMVAAIVMLAGVVPCGIVMCRGTVMEALVAYEVVSSIAVMVLILLAEGFGGPPSSSCRCCWPCCCSAAAWCSSGRWSAGCDQEITADVLLGLAAATVLASALGILVMRDVYRKLHYVTPAALVAPALVALAVFVREGVDETPARRCSPWCSW